MKHVQRYQSFNEAKHIGTLYHFTSLVNLYKIVKSNQLITTRTVGEMTPSAFREMFKDEYYFSFTRNKHLPRTANMFDHPFSCKIVVDGALLSNRYKLQPINFWFDTVKNVQNFGIIHSIRDESEEALINPSPILPYFSNYVQEISLPTLQEYSTKEFEFYKGVRGNTLSNDCNIYAKAMNLTPDEMDNMIEIGEFYDTDIETIYNYLVTSIRRNPMFKIK